ncbi:MAG: RidA family protein [Actinobacteria bacterium]|nr:RidA family protein [Actinomycetota bacterium]
MSTHRATDAWHSGAPYSPAVKVGATIYVSGTVPIDPATGETVGTDIGSQTERVLANIALTLEAAGSSLNRVVKTTVFITDSSLVAGMNETYRRHFPDHLPARSTVQVGPLARPEWLVEIEAVAVAAS